ncbi:hypothetical protein IL306_007908 [Fusarium sp. DS 682]|nr:hypothetical protein IL306_007908 [Fusarium sp. DS 682]
MQPNTPSPDAYDAAKGAIDLLIQAKATSSDEELRTLVPKLYNVLGLTWLLARFSSPRHVKKSTLQYIRDKFEEHSLLWHRGWTSPSKCCIDGPAWIRSKQSVSILPREWNLTSTTAQGIKEFYRGVLLIRKPEYTWRVAIRELEHQRALGGFASLGDVISLYDALAGMTGFHADPEMDMSDEQREAVSAAFHSQSWIAVKHKWGVKWLRRDDCVWTPGKNNTGKVDLSRRYPELMNFFLSIVRVDRPSKKSLDANWTPPSPAQLLDEVPTLEAINEAFLRPEFRLDRDKLLTHAIFPVRNPAGSVELMKADADFFIPNNARLAEAFYNQVPMLVLVPGTFPELGRLFGWLRVRNKYLSCNATERLVWPAGTKQTKVEWDIAEKAEAILRIAAHFNSPRTKSSSARRELLKLLKEGKIFAVKGAKPETRLSSPMTGHSFVATSTELAITVSMTESGTTLDKLIVHVSADEAE